MSTKFRKDSFIKNQQVIDGIFLDINKLPSVPVTLNDEEYTKAKKLRLGDFVLYVWEKCLDLYPDRGIYTKTKKRRIG